MNTAHTAVSALAERVPMTREAAKAVYRHLANAVRAGLRADGLVVLPGLGTLKVKEVAPRRHHNMHTKQIEMSKARRVVVFSPAGDLRDAV